MYWWGRSKCLFLLMIINYDIAQYKKTLLLYVLCLILFSACSTPNKDKVDRLNNISYAYHYRNLDSTIYYAKRALSIADKYDAGKAEAYNNLAFVSIARMDYPKVYILLDSIENITDNQVELLIADIQYMRLCQRQSKNKDFYDYRERAIRRQRRIEEEHENLSEHQRLRMIYAQSEYNIVTSIYFYYVGLKMPSIKALEAINPNGELEEDTAQLLNYWYNVGAGGIITKGTQEEIDQTEFDYLMRCYLSACQYKYPYWEAQALQGLSEHLQLPNIRNRLINANLPAMKYVNKDNMPDSLLAGNLAQRSLDVFSKYGDVYQIAGAHRTLAECYWAIKDYSSALICLQNALGRNTVINRAPDLVASIREQLCLVYSAVNQKPNSDYNRNIYLDLQEKTRQDRQLEARAGQLDKSSNQLNIMIVAVIIMIVIVVILLFAFDRMRRISDNKYSLDSFLEPLKEWERVNHGFLKKSKERYEEVNENIQMASIHIQNNKKRNLEQRAKITIVNSIIPFIDRMINEIHCLITKKENEIIRRERYNYIIELTDKINEYNATLTQWIQMRQGELSLHIESFALQSLFDIVNKGKMGFQLKGVKLIVNPTDDIVKADKALTLFMINTIADNARKFTPEGGIVSVSTVSTDNYVEISISDTGKGMSQKQQAHIFDYKQIIDKKEYVSGYHGFSDTQTSHGFGLMNCKGIIDKYRKISHIFDVCCIAVESTPYKGSRFSFRLPKGIIRTFVLLSLMIINLSIEARPNDIKNIKLTDNKKYETNSLSALDYAANFADSAYFSNINGTYRQTLVFADSCRYYLNQYYLQQNNAGKNLMVLYYDGVETPAEIKWFHDKLPTNYNVILDIRNESAVAALALHKWSLYKYNNKVYTQLFRESSADNTLTDYVRAMQKSENSKTVAVILLILLLLMVFPAYYFLYYRHRLYYRFCIDRIHLINSILLSDEKPETRLKKIENVWKSKKVTLNTKIPILETVVMQIERALRERILSQKIQQENIELAEDEWHRTEFENYNYYICNSVLDNCLSTLKHETMYYPPRIRHLIDGTDNNLQSIQELVSYYKDLYTILSAQAMRQINSIKQKCQLVNLPSICSMPILGDADMVKYLFEILRKESGEKKLITNVSEKGSRYVIIKVSMPNLNITDEQRRLLFTPSTINIQYMLCRQIIRDIGEATNARGCGILATRGDANGSFIEVTLAHG